MKRNAFDTVIKLNEYLTEAKKDSIQALKGIPTLIQGSSWDYIVFAFTHEFLEVFGIQKGGKSELITRIESINNYEIDDDILGLEEDEFWEEVYEEQLSEIKASMLRTWLIECFHEAQLAGKVTASCLFKISFDSLEVFDLKTAEIHYEKSELESFYRLNKDRAMDVTPIA